MTSVELVGISYTSRHSFVYHDGRLRDRYIDKGPDGTKRIGLLNDVKVRVLRTSIFY